MTGLAHAACHRSRKRPPRQTPAISSKADRLNSAREAARDHIFEASSLAARVADPRWEVTVLLHLSDPHFGTEAPEAVDALLALAARERPDVVVWSGDITQRARPAQFEAARRFHAALKAPHALAIPGNHDIALFDLWTRMTQPYGRFSAAFGPDLEPVYQSPDCLVVGVNTTRAGRHKHGEVSASQMARVVSYDHHLTH